MLRGSAMPCGTPAALAGGRRRSDRRALHGVARALGTLRAALARTADAVPVPEPAGAERPDPLLRCGAAGGADQVRAWSHLLSRSGSAGFSACPLEIA